MSPEAQLALGTACASRLQYAVLLYRNRNQLNELRLIEMTIEADLALARLDAEAVTSENEAAGVIRRAEAAYKQGREEFDRLRAKLPTTLRKLTAGYEMRTYWFEIFE